MDERYHGDARLLRGMTGFTLVELLIAIAISMILAALLLVAASRALGASRSASCQSNLRQMGIVIRMYSDANGVPPPSLKNVYPEYLNDLRILICPASSDAVGKYPEDVEGWCSYDYTVRERDASMQDKKRNHSGHRNTLSVSEQVDTVVGTSDTG